MKKAKFILALIVTLLLSGCFPETKEEQSTPGIDREAFLQGQLIYKRACMQCHQANGQGLKKIYPPLAQSDYLMNNKTKSIQFIKYGTNDTIVVNGQQYAFNMPANSTLTNEEIAHVMTYIYNAWGNRGGNVTIQDVQEALTNR